MKKQYLAGILLASLVMTGCSRQDMIHYFNNTDEAFVDNISENTEVVDSSQTGGNTESNENSDNGTDKGEVSSGEESSASKEPVYNGPEISLVMVGDILLHTPVEASCQKEDGSYDYHSLFSNVKTEIQSADLAMVNQEVILGGEELGVSGYPSFNAPYSVADALVDTGFDVVLHGTNHAMDQGKKGLTNCLSFWQKNYPDIAVLGINKSQEAQDTIYVYEQDGIKIAILNYTYGTNGISLPSDMPYAVNLLEEEKVTSDLEKANELADFVIVAPHWGTEYELGIANYQKHWANIFLKNGVDLVIGTHPHVIEPIEWLEDETTGNKMLVYYSLGNFVNWTSSSGEGIANRMVGGMADVTIGTDDEGNACVLDYGVKALVCQVEEGKEGVTTYFLSDYTDALASKNAIIAQDSSFSKEYCTTLCNTVWGDLWE